ncbi:MAG: hypothetical protein U0871_06260 [Gemmataceae bacterium]
MPTARNLTAGSLKLLDPKESGKRSATVRLRPQGGGQAEHLVHLQSLDTLKRFGFPVNPHTQSCPDIDAVIAHVQSWSEKRHDLPYDTDGMVIKVDSFAQRGGSGTRASSRGGQNVQVRGRAGDDPAGPGGRAGRADRQ